MYDGFIHDRRKLNSGPKQLFRFRVPFPNVEVCRFELELEEVNVKESSFSSGVL